MWVRTLFALIVAALLAGCAASPARVGEVDPAFEAPYALDSGDRLRVVVFGQDGLSNSYTVDTSGKIAMPLIGAVPARGKTTEQLAALVTARLKNGFVREPHVAVEVEVYRPFFILGEVNAAGQYPFVNGLTVESAIAVGGGYTPRASRLTAVIARLVEGQTVRARVPLYYPVRPGDTITVEERWL